MTLARLIFTSSHIPRVTGVARLSAPNSTCNAAYTGCQHSLDDGPTPTSCVVAALRQCVQFVSGIPGSGRCSSSHFSRKFFT